MNMQRRHAMVWLGAGLAGCGGGGDDEELLTIQAPPQGLRESLGIIATGTYVIESRSALEQLAATSAGTPIPADVSRVPPIDFTSSVLLAVGEGSGGNCWWAEFVEARRVGDVVTVTYRQVTRSAVSLGVCFGLAPLTLYALVPRGPARIQFERLPPRLVP
jgi:hypothetical protein